MRAAHAANVLQRATCARAPQGAWEDKSSGLWFDVGIDDRATPTAREDLKSNGIRLGGKAGFQFYVRGCAV
jgi:hypothetical protein